MKRILKSVIAVLLVISAFNGMAAATPFYITNNTSYEIGTVTFYNSDGVATPITVSGPGTYYIDLPGSPIAALIFNQGIPKNTFRAITLLSGVTIYASWSGNHLVISYDAAPNGGTFIITNMTNFPIGKITIYDNTGTAYTTDVGGYGTYYLTIQGSAAVAQINNQWVNKSDQTTDVILASNALVQANLNGSQIVVQDQSVVQGEPGPHGK